MSTKKRRKSSNPKSESSIKGKLVEMIVAVMHNNPDVRVNRNVKLPTVLNPKRKREIDVLINGSFAGYPVRIAIECKNYKSVIDVPKIDAYIGKLYDVGIPMQQGVYVAAHGYTTGALERAKEVGIIPLVLTGLTSDRLAAEIADALQSVVHLMLEITNLEIWNNIEKVDFAAFPWLLYDTQGKVRGSIPDLIWKKWIEGTMPSSIGEYEIEIEIPDGWYHYVGNMLQPIVSAKAKITVIGLLVEFRGQGTQHTLINPIEKEINRFRAEVSFDIAEGTYPVASFDSEENLHSYLDQHQEKIKLVSRFRLPRIRCYSIYWPLSKTAVNKLTILSKQCYEEGRVATYKELREIEGDDMKAIWDTIWEENPILREIKS